MNVDDVPYVNRTSIILAEKHDVGLDESLAMMNESKLFLIASESICTSIPLQASYLTAINAGKRTFLGGIYCSLKKDIPNLLPINGKTFNELVEKYGGILLNKPVRSNDLKLVFGLQCPDHNSFEVVCSGWQAGINFYNQKRINLPSTSSKTTLGGIVAASLGLFYAFNRTFKIIDSPLEFSTGISLWNLDTKNWNSKLNEGPMNPLLPKHVWNVGLGHLGQAYLWTLGLMSNKERPYVTLLQDYDLVGKENLGSQILCERKDLGQPKARVCSKFMTDLGMKTKIIEKPFLTHDQENNWSNDFKFLLNGVDNIQTRRSIRPDRFNLFLDGGTNGKLELFDSFTMRNFGLLKKDPKEVWKILQNDQEIKHKNLYNRIQKEHGCGQLINKNISTPFVGLFGAGLLISELIRALNGGRVYSSLSVQMRDLTSIRLGLTEISKKKLFELAI